MTTALDIITDALKRAQVYGAGEILSAADQEDCLVALNGMMDEWSNESLACYANLEQTITLIPGQSAYTVGPGGYLNGVRPLDITVGPGAARITDTNGNRYDVDVVTQDRFNTIGAPYTQANFPDTLFYDPQFPLGIVNFFPTPNIAYTATWDSRLQLQEFPNLTTALTLPPGYFKAIATNLALELFPYFAAKGEQPSPLLALQALNAKGAIKRQNMKEVVAFMDPAVVSRAQGTYNVLTDSFNKSAPS